MNKYLNKSVVSIFFIFVTSNLFGQQIIFEKTFSHPPSSYCYDDGDASIGMDIATTSDSNFVILSRCHIGRDSCQGFLGTEVGIQLLKINFIGDTIWSRIILDDEQNQYINAGPHLQANRVVTVHNTSFLIAGAVDSIPMTSHNAFLLKVDSAGNRIWFRQYLYNLSNIQEFFDIIESADLGYMALGTAYNSASSNESIYLVKTDSSGNKLWENVYVIPSFGSCRRIVDNFNNTYTLLGETVMPGTYGYKFFMINVDSLGNELSRYYLADSSNIQRFFNGMRTLDNNYLLMGSQFDSIPTVPKLVTTKVDYFGNILWSTINGDSLIKYAGQNIIQLDDSSYIVVGTAIDCFPWFGSYACGPKSFLLSKIDKSGNREWEHKWKYNNGDHARVLQTIKIIDPERYVACGTVVDTSNIFRMTYLIAFDSLYINSSTGIDDFNMQMPNVNLFPNPSNGKLNINLNNKIIENVTIEIYNFLGYLVYEERVNLYSGGKEFILPSTMSSGLFICVIRSHEFVSSKKFILIRD